MPSRGNEDDKRNWANLVRNCETDICICGEEIAGLKQSPGRIIKVIHTDGLTKYGCSFTGTLTPQMRERFEIFLG